ncbi:MAG TPA: ATP-binding protein [Trebonia sp.]
MISPLAARIRYAGVAYVVVQTVIWHSFYTHHPWRLTGPAVAVAWGLVVAARLRRSWPSHWFACLDCLVYVVLAVGAQACVPPAVRDDAFSWLVISLSGQLMVPAWYSPGVLSLLPPLCAPLFFGAGALLQPVTNGRTLAVTTIMLLVIGFVHGCGRRICYRRATAADAGLNRADQAAGEQYAALQVALERREQERLVHDTVLNTLTALSRAGGDDPALVIDRSRRDVDLIEAALTGTGTGTLAAGAGRPPRERPGPRPGESPARRPGPGDLAGLPGRVQSVATAMRGRGLTVHLELPDEAGPAIPEPVVTALVNATREALSNVAAHAGTGEAWVQVRIRPAGQAAVPCRAEVTVRDRGAGFDPAYVDPARLGLRRSIAQRAAEYGGQASIWSAPGRGTEVFLRWPAPALPPSAERAAPGARPPWNTAPFPAVLVPAGRDLAAGGPAQEAAREP